MKFIGLFLALCFAVGAEAQLLKTVPGPKTINDVTIADSAVAIIDGQTATQGIIGAGERSKSFLNIKVYVGELFGSDPSKFVRSNDGFKALDSLDGMQTVSILLVFQHDVTADQIRGAFEDALDVNKINLDDPVIKKFLDAVNSAGDTKPGQTMTVVTRKYQTGDSVYFENGAGKVSRIDGPSGFARQIMSIWLGNIVSSEGGLKDLKAALIAGVN